MVSSTRAANNLQISVTLGGLLFRWALKHQEECPSKLQTSAINDSHRRISSPLRQTLLSAREPMSVSPLLVIASLTRSPLCRPSRWANIWEKGGQISVKKVGKQSRYLPSRLIFSLRIAILSTFLYLRWSLVGMACLWQCLPLWPRWLKAWYRFQCHDSTTASN